MVLGACYPCTSEILGWEYPIEWESSGGNTRVGNAWGENPRVYQSGFPTIITALRVIFPTRRAWENPLFPIGIPTVYFSDVCAHDINMHSCTSQYTLMLQSY